MRGKQSQPSLALALDLDWIGLEFENTKLALSCLLIHIFLSGFFWEFSSLLKKFAQLVNHSSAQKCEFTIYLCGHFVGKKIILHLYGQLLNDCFSFWSEIQRLLFLTALLTKFLISLLLWFNESKFDWIVTHQSFFKGFESWVW